MTITLKLYAGLQKYLPEGSSGVSVQLQIDPDSTPELVLKSLNIPQQTIHLVMINGIYLAPDARNQTFFNDNDVLAVWPAVAGG